MSDHETRRASGPLAEEQTVHVLHVEDNPADISLMREALKDSTVPCRFTWVTDGEQALDYLHRRGPYIDAPLPDLILLDLNLPKLDGREVLRIIKQDLTLAGIPVVVLTTSTAEADVRAVYDLRANCFVPKPHDVDQFFRLVHLIEEYWIVMARLPRRPRLHINS